MENKKSSLIQLHIAVLLFGISGLFGKIFDTAVNNNCAGKSILFQYISFSWSDYN